MTGSWAARLVRTLQCRGTFSILQVPRTTRSGPQTSAGGPLRS